MAIKPLINTPLIKVLVLYILQYLASNIISRLLQIELKYITQLLIILRVAADKNKCA